MFEEGQIKNRKRKISQITDAGYAEVDYCSPKLGLDRVG